ncbi:hypothetical protein [Halocatena halophila]|uniref:hypothetical protein n=1 Tax=Halocatena halophila TaxID=2814576 RepID=UPI002ED0E165
METVIIDVPCFVVCTDCGKSDSYADRHAARRDDWHELSIDGVVGPADQSEWYGLCPECSR